MAKLTRVPAKVFAASAVATEIGQFGSAVAGSKLETADVATIQGLSAWLDGWSEALVSGNRYPALQEMNGLLKVLSYQGAYALQEGIAEYNADTTYYIGSIVKKTGTFELYGSLTDDNLGNALTVGASWKLLIDLNNVSSSAIIPLGSSSTASATAEKAITATGFTLTRGAMLAVIFANANTATTPTLNVNSLGAKPIKLPNGLVNPNLTSSVEYLFLYDGTSFLNITNQQIWTSGDYTPVADTPTVASHNLNLLNSLNAKGEVLLKCVIADAGYSVGDLMTFDAYYGDVFYPTIVLSSNTIKIMTSNGIVVCQPSGAAVNINFANWRYVFRIFY